MVGEASLRLMAMVVSAEVGAAPAVAGPIGSAREGGMGSEVAGWPLCAGFAANATCSIGLAGLAGGTGTNATFSLRDSGAAASAGGFSAGLRGVATALAGGAAAAASSACSLPPLK